jgi:ubiquinone/menaquinone biosynthesis C-methylase UbiE
MSWPGGCTAPCGPGDYIRVAEQLTGVSAAVMGAACIGPGLRVLDLGAGSGNTALLAAGQGRR